jgi:hypothetical protein
MSSRTTRAIAWGIAIRMVGVAGEEKFMFSSISFIYASVR